MPDQIRRKPTFFWITLLIGAAMLGLYLVLSVKPSYKFGRKARLDEE